MAFGIKQSFYLFFFTHYNMCLIYNIDWLIESLCQNETDSDVDEETDDSAFDIVSPLQTEGLE